MNLYYIVDPSARLRKRFRRKRPAGPVQQNNYEKSNSKLVPVLRCFLRGVYAREC